jgi:hypothetical protein
MQTRERFLKYYLYISGFASAIVITTVPVIFGDTFLWQPRNIPTEIMMASIYLAMGIIMILVARKPLKNKAFIDFVILANTLHAGVMLYFAHNPAHIVLDVIPIGLMGLLPLLMYPWGLRNFLRGYT